MLLEKEKELLEREQTVMVLREEVRPCLPPSLAPLPLPGCAGCRGPHGRLPPCCLRGVTAGRWGAAQRRSRCCFPALLPPPAAASAFPASDFAEPTRRPAVPCRHPQHSVPATSSPPLPGSPPSLQLEIEKKLRTLLTKEKEKAEEEATLAMGLCTGGSMLP